MARRIRLYVDDSLVASGVTHRIYRHQVSGQLPDPSVQPLIEFREGQVQAAPCEIDREELTQDDYEANCFHTTRVICDDYLVELAIDGEPVPAGALRIDYESGRIWITDRPIPFYFGKTVTATYHYTAFEVWDQELPQTGVTFRGTAATGLRKPVNLQATWDAATSRAAVSWEPAPESDTYYYRSRMELEGCDPSPWSDEYPVTLTPDPATLHYEVWKERPDGTQLLAATVTDLSWTDPDSPPLPCPAEVAFTWQSDGTLDVALADPFTGAPPRRLTARYQVALVDDLGARTERTDPVQPDAAGLPLVRAVLRRKVHNGTPAPLDGDEAVTLIDITAGGPESFPVVYNDSLLADGIYCYSAYVTDESGLVSEPRSWVVNAATQEVTNLGGEGS